MMNEGERERDRDELRLKYVDLNGFGSFGGGDGYVVSRRRMSYERIDIGRSNGENFTKFDGEMRENGRI
jgi:hypothetical protein